MEKRAVYQLLKDYILLLQWILVFRWKLVKFRRDCGTRVYSNSNSDSNEPDSESDGGTPQSEQLA